VHERPANTDALAVTLAIAGCSTPRFTFANAITHTKSLAGGESLASHPPLALHGSVTYVYFGKSLTQQRSRFGMAAEVSHYP